MLKTWPIEDPNPLAVGFLTTMSHHICSIKSPTIPQHEVWASWAVSGKNTTIELYTFLPIIFSTELKQVHPITLLNKFEPY